MNKATKIGASILMLAALPYFAAPPVETRAREKPETPLLKVRVINPEFSIDLCGADRQHLDPDKFQITFAPEDEDRLNLANAYLEYAKREGRDPEVIRAIYRASVKTGVDMKLLLVKARIESDLGLHTKAQTSSARGVFQYIEPTWLILMKRYGAQLGYGDYAQAIKIGKYSGIPNFKGSDDHLRAEILALRFDPYTAAMVKALQIKDETQTIRGFKHGAKVTPTDHYIAHMLGLGLMKDLLDLKQHGSVIAPASLSRPEMREAAHLNRSFFYSKNRDALSAAAVYKKFEDRINAEYAFVNYVERAGAFKAAAARRAAIPSTCIRSAMADIEETNLR